MDNKIFPTVDFFNIKIVFDVFNDLFFRVNIAIYLEKEILNLIVFY